MTRFPLGAAVDIIERNTPEERKVLADPYGISPARGVDQPGLISTKSITYQGKKLCGGFWVMAPTNEEVVRRSWGVLQQEDKDRAYGAGFSYREVFAAGSWAGAATVTSLLYIFLAAMREWIL